MATRLYLPSSGAEAVTPSSWQFAATTTTTYTYAGARTKGATALATLTQATGTTSPIHRGMARWVIGPLSAQTISGTLTGQIRCSESATGANATVAVAVKIIQPNGADRATLLSQDASDNTSATPPEMSASLYTRSMQGASENLSIALTSQDASSGDYLVVEIGFRSATTTTRNVLLRIGDDSASDLSSGSTTTDTNDYAPWVEFSGDILFVRTGSLAVTESGPDTFDGFFTDGIRRDEGGQPVTDEGGGLIYDGWVTAIGPIVATESGADSFSASGSVGASALTGAMAATETGSDAFSSTGKVVVKGSSAVNETGADAISSTGKVVVKGPLSVAESATSDSVSSSGKVIVKGYLAATESGVDAFQATAGSGRYGALSATESGADTIEAFFTDGIRRDENREPILDENGNFIHDGWVTAIGPCAAVESGADILAASGSVQGNAVSGAMAASEAATKDAFAAIGKIVVKGAISVAEPATSDSVSSSGKVIVKGSIATTETGQDTFYSSAGTGRLGSMAATESGADTISAPGKILVRGNGTIIETGSDVAALSGKVLVSGHLAATETYDGFASSGKVVVKGACSATEQATDTFYASGRNEVVGRLSVAESGIDVAAASGKIIVNGSFTATEQERDTFFAVGSMFVVGYVTAQEEYGDVFAGSGDVPVSGNVECSESGHDTMQSPVLYTTSSGGMIFYRQKLKTDYIQPRAKRR